ncbi:hypothetical protein KIL84_022662 [Mauremys mutica]|uniref:Uncharacterized protein n=1 Tax=Mauremys mutica TaxID=74926 RepID=A0A9D4ANZ8_9SAUR|nr:hypothetical protein KIL84_022662 [Mauremys mutica]
MKGPKCYSQVSPPRSLERQKPHWSGLKSSSGLESRKLYTESRWRRNRVWFLTPMTDSLPKLSMPGWRVGNIRNTDLCPSHYWADSSLVNKRSNANSGQWHKYPGQSWTPSP